MRYAIYLLALILFFAGCSGEGNGSESRKLSISGYAEDDPFSRAAVVVENENGETVANAETDENGYYQLEGECNKDKLYVIKTTTDQNLSMRAAFICGEEISTVNINPLTELAVRLYTADESLGLQKKENEVLAYFGLFDRGSVFERRFMNETYVYQTMQTFADDLGRNLPMDILDDLFEDIRTNKNALRHRIAQKVVLNASAESVEVNHAIDISIGGIDSLNDHFDVVWVGLDENDETPLNQTIVSSVPGDKTIYAKIYDENKLLEVLSVKVNFFETGITENIAINNAGLEANATIGNVKVAIPAHATNGNLDEIAVTFIEKNSKSTLQTIKMEPSGTTFLQPVEVRIPYSLDTVEDPSQLTVVRTEEDGSIELLKPQIDYKKQELIIETDHFSTLIVFRDDNGREYFNPYVDIEEMLFTADGGYEIELGLDDNYFGDFVHYMANSIELKAEAKARMTTFYEDGYDGWDGFDEEYIKAFRYVLAEDSGAESVDMNKYAVLVDSLKKFRIAKLIDGYLQHDMLKTPYEYHFGFGETTRSDFLNEILRVESESYGLDDGYNVTGNAAWDVYQTLDSAKSINDTARSILNNGFSATGLKIAKTYVIDTIINDFVRELNAYVFNESLTYLQCFDTSIENDIMKYKIGASVIFELSPSGQVTNADLSKLDDIVSAADDMQSESANVQAAADLYQIGEDGIAFMECAYRKAYLFEEVSSQQVAAANGFDYLVKVKSERVKLYEAMQKLNELIKNGNAYEYNTILKIMGFDEDELEEYKNYLLALATANAEPIITSIMIEKRFIEEAVGNNYPEIRADDLGFFNERVVSNEGFIRFRDYYKTHAAADSKESTAKLPIFDTDWFNNLALRIEQKYMDDFALTSVKLDLSVIPLVKSVSDKSYVESYYETAGATAKRKFSKKDVGPEAYTLDVTNHRYEVSLGDLFPEMALSEPEYIEATIDITATYKGRVLALTKTLTFISDSTNQLIVEPVTRGSLVVNTLNASGTALENAEVRVASKTCMTNVNGNCALSDFVPGEYMIMISKDGYLPAAQTAFLESGIEREIDFTLKPLGDTDALFLEVSAIGSEVNPLEYSFFVLTNAEDANVAIDFGDDSNTSGKLVSLLNDDGYMKHTYETAGLKEVVITVRDINGSEKSVAVMVYPVIDGVIANAGPNQTVHEGDSVTLDGSASIGDISSFTWSENSSALGTGVTLTKSNLMLGMHTITLTVKDDMNAMDTDTVTITIYNSTSDADGDSMPDEWELRHGLDMTLDDSATDADGDGISNGQEYEDGTDPQIWTSGAGSKKILKTGQTKSYDVDGNEVADGSVKDDGYYQTGAARSYTRDDVKEIVTDNVTGLMWQDDADAANVNKTWVTQENFDAGDYNNTSGDTAATYCEELTLGEYNDWRLPTAEELLSITDMGRYNPAIDIAFHNVTWSAYGSSTFMVSNPQGAWFVNFAEGFEGFGNKAGLTIHVRCVRSRELSNASE